MVPHNHFVHILYRGGLIGLFATLYIFYQLLRSGVKGLKNTDKRWAPYFLAVFAAFLSYYIPYWASYGHGILIGIAISYFGIARTQRVSHFQPNFGQPHVGTGNY
jgi:O-antigen ligase